MADSYETKYSDLYNSVMYNVDGYYWNSLDMANGIKEVLECECYEDDIWIDTYPKSGTLWVKTIITAILCNGNTDLTNQQVQKRKSIPLELNPSAIQVSLSSYSPRILITHAPYRFFPHQAITKKSKIIYMVRNPKDVAVSYYHFHKMNKSLGFYQGTWDQFFSYYISGEVGYGSWFDHVITWWEQSKIHPNILFLKFEDLKKDLKPQIQKIAQYLGYTLDEDTISSIQEYCQFETMVNNEPINSNLYKDGSLIKTISPFLRKGDVGDWKNYLSEEENKQFDELFEVKMKGSGLDIEFEI